MLQVNASPAIGCAHAFVHRLYTRTVAKLHHHPSNTYVSFSWVDHIDVIDQVFADQIGANLQLQRRAVISWPNGPPRRVLMVKKAGSRPAAQALHTLADWCVDGRNE